MQITELYKTQISLTEWLEKIGHEQTAALRREDNEKRDRLRLLNDCVGLPFDRPFQCAATDIRDRSENFVKFLAGHGSELCALRLVPRDSALPKLRMRGHTVAAVLRWFAAQTIDAEMYKAEFVPHADNNLWSTIFVVNDCGIVGEIIAGGHHQLTQGFYDDVRPITFSFDWQNWRLGEVNDHAKRELEKIIDHLKISDLDRQTKLMGLVGASFAQGYLKGYFETVTSAEFGLWFIDYNRLLCDLYNDFVWREPTAVSTGVGHVIGGYSGAGGIARGTARLIRSADLAETPALRAGEILICEMTTPDYIPLMQSAAAVVTDLGGILSHAAIVCRELHKPCVVGTKNATTTLHDGDLVEVDGESGVVRVLPG